MSLTKKIESGVKAPLALVKNHPIASAIFLVVVVVFLGGFIVNAYNWVRAKAGTVGAHMPDPKVTTV